MDLGKNSHEERQAQGVGAYSPLDHITMMEESGTEMKKRTTSNRLGADRGELRSARTGQDDDQVAGSVVSSAA